MEEKIRSPPSQKVKANQNKKMKKCRNDVGLFERKIMILKIF